MAYQTINTGIQYSLDDSGKEMYSAIQELIEQYESKFGDAYGKDEENPFGLGYHRNEENDKLEEEKVKNENPQDDKGNKKYEPKIEDNYKGENPSNSEFNSENPNPVNTTRTIEEAIKSAIKQEQNFGND